MKQTQKLVFSGLMLSMATVLSLIKIIDLPLGGSLTAASMLPLVLVALRYSLPWSLMVSFAHGVIQLLLGLANIGYAVNIQGAIAIILFDYLVAFTAIGLSGIFKKNMSVITAAVLGIILSFTLRFLCHFFTGWFIWDAIWPNDLGLAAPIYSLYYNGSYMVLELAVTLILTLAILKVKPLTKLLLDK